MRSSTTTIISALRILSHDIKSEDGVANAAIAEAADRLEGLSRENARLQMELDASCNAEELRQVRAENAALWEDKARLDSGTILLTVGNGRVHHIGVDLRAAIEAGWKGGQP